MKSFAPTSLLLAGIFAAGCASDQFQKLPASATKPLGDDSGPISIIVQPDNSVAGKIILFNSDERFVVVNFPGGQMPKMDETLFVYRAGLKTGEIKITGPQSDRNIVADLTGGSAQAGDEVRDQ